MGERTFDPKLDAEIRRRRPTAKPLDLPVATTPCPESPPVPFLDVVQQEQRAWVGRNFPGRQAYQPLLGAVEELGELAHHHLKASLGIRGSQEEHLLAERDAVGDIVLFLADYCSARGFSLQECVETTWATVRKRDWLADPENGTHESTAHVAFDKAVRP